MAEKKRKSLKIAMIVIGAIILLSITAQIVVMLFLNPIIKAGITTILPKVTGTPIEMGSFNFSPLGGKLKLKNFIIGNPAGYQGKYAFKLKTLKVDLDVASLFSDKIIIREILVDGIGVAYETKLTESNIGRIKKNIGEYGKKAAQDKEKPKPAEKDKKPEDKEKKPGKKLQIDELRFINGSVALQASLLDTGTGAKIPLPEIQLQDIGKKDTGATVAEASEQIYAALYVAILKAVKNLGKVDSKDLEKGADQLLKETEKATEGVVKGVKDLF